MLIKISNKIRIVHPTPQVVAYAEKELVIPNPEYAKKQRMGFWTGNTPKVLHLYETEGEDTLILPVGCLSDVKYFMTDTDLVVSDFGPSQMLDGYNKQIPLYDYQEVAMNQMLRKGYGVLQAPAGSGKTQIGIALASNLMCKTLWLTHTVDLLNQSYDRAALYMDKKKLGQITDGKVNIGSHITFATVQTMASLDLNQYADMWDTVIVDECHRVAGTPTAVSMFSKVLNSLKARHKYGLSATLHRADGLIKCTYALLGEVAHIVPKEAVASKIMTVKVDPIATDTGISHECLDSDGTLNFNGLNNYLSAWAPRNELIVDVLKANREHYNLILSSRVAHLEALIKLLNVGDDACLITGKMTSKKGKEERQQAIEDLRSGNKHYLFATYNLAKEGLDIPRLDRLYLVTPQKDYAVITQSVGRVARTFEGKETPIVYDFVDNIGYCMTAFRKRCTSYRKIDAEIGGIHAPE